MVAVLAEGLLGAPMRAQPEVARLVVPVRVALVDERPWQAGLVGMKRALVQQKRVAARHALQ